MRPARQTDTNVTEESLASYKARQRQWPWLLALPGILVGIGLFVPLGYLVFTAWQGADEEVHQIILRAKTLRALANTLGLCVAVLAATLVLALPAAWLVTRSSLPGSRLWSVLLVLPLAVPGYLMAYTLLSIGGAYGASQRLLDLPVPRLSGFSGSVLALTLYNFPYLFLTLRSGLLRTDPSLWEAARSLGDGAWQAFYRVELPQLRPALLAGALLVVLHVLGDFGVVSLMRFETLSVLLYGSLAFEPSYAASVAVMMVGIAGIFITLEAALLHRQSYGRVTPSTLRRARLIPLGRAQWLVIILLTSFLLVAVGLPLLSSLYWWFQPTLGYVTRDWASSTAASLQISIPAAVICAAIALTLALLTQRYPSWRSRGLERVAYAGYATPGLAFGLAFIGAALWVDRLLVPAGETLLYQSLGLVIGAYTLHFLAEAIGPIRSGLYLTGVRLEEAARNLGRGPVHAFFSVTFPQLRSGLTASMVLVFLSAIKELPIVMLLRPTNYDTLAFNLWDLSNENLYAEAAPFALTILAVSLLFVGLLLYCDRRYL